MRNKNKKTPKEEQDDKLMEEDLLKQIAKMKGIANEEAEGNSLGIAQQPHSK